MEFSHDRSFSGPSFGAGEMPKVSSLSWLCSHPLAGQDPSGSTGEPPLEISEQHHLVCHPWVIQVVFSDRFHEFRSLGSFRFRVKAFRRPKTLS